MSQSGIQAQFTDRNQVQMIRDQKVHEDRLNQSLTHNPSPY